MRKITNLLFSFGLFAILSFPLLALGADPPAAGVAPADFVPLTNLPGLSEAVTSETLPDFLNQLYRLCIGAAAVIAVLQIMRAGMYFMFNKGSVAHNEKAKGLIQNSVLGLLLVLSPAIVFGVINPDILDLKLNFDALKTKEAEPGPTSDGGTQSCPVAAEKKAVAGTGQAACTQLGVGYQVVDRQCCPAQAGFVCCAKSGSAGGGAASEGSGGGGGGGF